MTRYPVPSKCCLRVLPSLFALGAALAFHESAAQAQQALPTIDVGAHRRATTRVAAPPAARPVAPVAAPATSAEPAQTNFAADVARVGRGPTGVTGYVASGTSTATKTATRIMDIPQAVSIVTKQQLQDRNSISLDKALTYVPGVFVSQGEGNRDQITIRGQDTTADFYTDGVRDDAQYYRDLYNIDAVEVLKGPSALIFGRGGGGGVVNRVTKKADGETIRAFSFSGGSFARKRGTADIGQAITDNLAVRLNTMYEHSYSYRDFVKLERYGVNPTMTWRPGEKTFVTLSYEHFRDRRTADRGVPSIGGLIVGGQPVFPAYPADVPRDFFFGNPDANYSKADVNRATLTLEHTTDFGLNIRNNTVYADYQKRYQNTFPDQAVNGTTVRLDGYVSSNPRQNIFNQTDFTYKWRMNEHIGHTILFGAEVGNQKTDDIRNLGRWNNPINGPQRISTPFWYPSVFNPVWFVTPNRIRHSDLDLAAGYVQDQIAITKYVDVLAGVRFDSFDLTFQDKLAGQEFRRVDNVWSPRVGLVVKPFEQLSLYGSYSRSFLPSAGDQFNLLTVSAASLAPQSFENFEAGFKAQILPNLYFTGALFTLNRSNQPVTVGPLNSVLADTQTNGGEIGLTGYVTDEWQVSLGYGQQAAYVKNAGVNGSATAANILTAFGNVGKVVPAVPRDTFSFWNKYDVSSLLGAGPGVLGVGAGVVYNSRFYAALDNAVVVPSSARVDGALFLKLTENVSGQLNVENIAGAHYFASAHNNNNIMPGAPRTAYVTVNAKF